MKQFLAATLLLTVMITAGGEDFEELKEIHADLDAIQGLWADFKKAHEANDRERILEAFAPWSRERYETMYSYIKDVSDMPSRWRDFTPIERTADFYMFALLQSGPQGDRLYTVVFVRVRDVGWRIEQM